MTFVLCLQKGIVNLKKSCFCHRFASKYTKTLNLPATKFPAYVKKNVRATHDENIRKKHFKPLYRWQREHLKGSEFVLHDGPPYANGDLHMGHAVNKISKDFVLRYQIMKGNRVHFRPGWNCHGLPIEMKAKSIRDGMSPIEVRNHAREFARSTIETQKHEMESWGVTADWENPSNIYRTFDADYIDNQLKLFYDLFNKKLIFRGFKPVYWSPSSKTALAEAELEYDKNAKSPSLYIRFKLSKISESLKKYGNVYALIWTTTPWTLPANQAVCFNSEIQYALVQLNGSPEIYVVATDLIPNLREKFDSIEVEEVATLGSADDLLECTYLHPIDKTTELPFLRGDHVTASAGTGLVHTAPAHGFDDYLLALSENIPVKCIVDSVGKYNTDSPEFLRGKEVIVDGNRLCLDNVKSDTIHLGTIVHSCPIDWRTKEPVIINATYQWFIDISAIRDEALSEIAEIKIYPSTSDSRSDNPLALKVRQRPYWCISRQRAWGTPIPVFYRKDNGEVIMTENILNHLRSLLHRNKSMDFWWTSPVDELLPEKELEVLNLSTDQILRGNDILDIWFDSGISWSYALESPKVADLYLEGHDQFTGWFQASLITSVAARGKSPYKSIFVHGFTVDKDGKKMSKSIGNVTHPKDIVQDYSTDVLRWWVASHLKSSASMPVKPHLLELSANDIQTIRKILRYLVGHIAKEKSVVDGNFDVKYDRLTPLDIYSLNALAKFEKDARESADNYRFPVYINNITKYTDELSGFYIDNIKDRLYLGTREDYEQILNVLKAQFCIVNKVLWPIIPHLVEECWSYYCEKSSFYSHNFSIPNEWHNTKYDDLMKIVKRISTMIRENISKSPVYFDVTITASDSEIELLHSIHPGDGDMHNDSHLCEILQVQSVKLQAGTELSIVKIEHGLSLCERCRRFSVPSPNSICLRCENILACTST